MRHLPCRIDGRAAWMAALLILAGGSSFAALPDRPTGYVTDEAGVLDSTTVQQLDALLADLDRKTSAQIAVVTLKSLEGEDINEAAMSLYKRWGIGQKGKDNGVLFLIAPNDRKTRIEVGYGLEGILPDAYTGRILDQYVLPSFREGQIQRGVSLGTFALAETVARDAKVNLEIQFTPPAGPVSKPLSFREIIVVIVLILFAIIVFIRHPWLFFLLLSGRGHRGGGWSGGGFGGGGFGGFGGGGSGGGGASRGW